MTKESGKLSDAQYQDRVRKVQKERERQVTDDLLELVRHEWGRRLAYWLIFEHGRVHGLCFDPGIKDGLCASLHQAKAEGRRESAHELHAMISAVAPEAVIAMMGERGKRALVDLSLESVAPTQEGA